MKGLAWIFWRNRKGGGFREKEKMKVNDMIVCRRSDGANGKVRIKPRGTTIYQFNFDIT